MQHFLKFVKTLKLWSHLEVIVCVNGRFNFNEMLKLWFYYMSFKYRKLGWLGQIFNIFINIFGIINWSQDFIWGLVIKYHVRATHIHVHSINSSWLLHSKIFNTVKPCQKSPRCSGWLWTPKHTWFSKVILLQGFKIILSVTYLGQDISF